MRNIRSSWCERNATLAWHLDFISNYLERRHLRIKIFLRRGQVNGLKVD